jgi:NADH:ubiquinone oxidoreductase subunit F (NADH-binding)
MTRLRELARRRSHGAPLVGFDSLRSRSLEVVSNDTGLPRSAIAGVRTFYDSWREEEGRACTGTACWFARGARGGPEGTHCLGRCYEAPVPNGREPSPIPARSLCEPVVLRHVLGSSDPLAEYDLGSGLAILDAIDRSGLRGRGGAAYPTGAKWRAALRSPGHDRVVVANGDEGDPGSFVDRLLLLRSPHAVLAGMKACARAIDAHIGIVFVRAEYPDAARSIEQAIGEATRAGLLGDFAVRCVRGAGSYVAGEETALLRAIEGRRAEPSPKPPYPAERGLFDLPTVVQNVETLSVVPWIVANGKRGHTKAFSISGAVKAPAVLEAPLGTALATVLAECGGPPDGLRWKMALVGGPMGTVVPAGRFDVALDYDSIALGHGGIVVLDESVSARALAEHLFAFARTESCGACTPCRVGTSVLESRTTRTALERTLETLEIGSLCAFGKSVPRPIRDLLTHFPDEMFA